MNIFNMVRERWGCGELVASHGSTKIFNVFMGPCDIQIIKRDIRERNRLFSRAFEAFKVIAPALEAGYYMAKDGNSEAVIVSEMGNVFIESLPKVIDQIVTGGLSDLIYDLASMASINTDAGYQPVTSSPGQEKLTDDSLLIPIAFAVLEVNCNGFFSGIGRALGLAKLATMGLGQSSTESQTSDS